MNGKFVAICLDLGFKCRYFITSRLKQFLIQRQTRLPSYWILHSVETKSHCMNHRANIKSNPLTATLTKCTTKFYITNDVGLCKRMPTNCSML